MKQLYQFQGYGKAIITIIAFALIFYGGLELYSLTFISMTFIYILKTLIIPSRKRIKFSMISLYLLFLAFQLSFAETIFQNGYNSAHIFGKILAAFFLIAPLTFENLFINEDYTKLYFPNRNEITTMSYGFIKDNRDTIISGIGRAKDIRKGINRKNLLEVISDIPRHGYVSYVNEGSLNEEYFKLLDTTLEDPYVYIVLSNTGSGASEIISAFTKRNYAHCSISFDADLKSIISFNGGERINPPGLNHEALEFFNKKDDASIIVYKLYAGLEKKQEMINMVDKINEQGSAYNVIGLFRIDLSKPNMMVCSQFVYMLLKSVGLEYFEKKPSKVKPTDLIELDYHRKLIFEYELFLNEQKL